MADTKIVSEVAGSVWKILVEVGDQVSANTPVALIESMKMEVPVLASDDGLVVEIYLAVGDSIAEGQAVLAIRD
ncbi:MAG: acetyl-CoA carboxylase biotin carboxyl carrier protein subunit [Betaproteobacteria bacterium RIFCSPLOWO2_02_FULL_67_19]|nr:MAG: acetyl-CoA carboxylase biotin carboxyl carrier protein subunit [Betaproteobacteria bacterium RIFCSPLOWO2_02_FULL_67_19]